MNRLLMISTSYPDPAYSPGEEAAGRFVQDFAQVLAKQVDLCLLVPGTDPTPTQEGAVAVRRFQVPRLPLHSLNPIWPNNWFTIAGVLRSGNAALTDAIDAFHPDHLLALWALPSGHWAQRSGLPYSIWALGSDIWSLGRLPLVKRRLQQVLARASNCFADGYLLADQVRSLGGSNCHFLPSTRRLRCDLPVALSTRPPYRICYLGRWHPNKGIDLLLQALGKLRDADWAAIAEVRIHGGGPLAPQVRQAADALQSAGRPITLGGYLDQSEATDLLLWADYLLLPSRIESIPLVFFDAMQAHTPIVSMPVGDLPRLINEFRVGMLAETVSAAAFAHALSEALRTPPATYQPALTSVRQTFNSETIASSLLAYLFPDKRSHG